MLQVHPELIISPIDVNEAATPQEAHTRAPPRIAAKTQQVPSVQVGEENGIDVCKSFFFCSSTDFTY